MADPEQNIVRQFNRHNRVKSAYFGAVPLDFLSTSEEHACPYLAGKPAREEFFLSREFPPELYHDFMNCGFRRSGLTIYRPVCRSCVECRQLRVIANEYQPGKSHRRVLRKNSDVELVIGKPTLTSEKVRVYSDYLNSQHGSGDNNKAENLKSFLYTSCVNTREFEYRLKGRLVASSVLDICSRSLSSVYTYFDPEFSARSLGTFSAIREILFCQEYSTPYYYLGFSIADCASMNYKKRYKPHEILDESLVWTRS
jgi:arginyl-tRNA--protein-N-Asp/Glu arginylyltransferase